jgi:hypothetical protein
MPLVSPPRNTGWCGVETPGDRIGMRDEGNGGGAMDAGVNCSGMGVPSKNDGTPGVMPTDGRPGMPVDGAIREEWPPRCSLGGANTLELRAVPTLGPALENDVL